MSNIIPRLPDWETRLNRQLMAAANRPFEWGSHDCALFVAGVIDAVLGVDPAGQWRGTYDSEYSALRRCMERVGGGWETAIREGAAGLRLRRVDPRFAHRGDVGLARGSDGLICAVACVGSTWVGTGPGGLVDARTCDIVAAWQVGRTSSPAPARNGLVLPDAEIDPLCAMAILAPIAGIIVSAAVGAIPEIAALGSVLAGVISGLAGMMASMAVSFIFTPSAPKQHDNSHLRISWDTTAAHRLVYGRVRVSGPCTFKKAYPASGSSKNDYFMLVMPIAAHITKGVDEFWINDTKVVATGDDGAVTDGEFKETAWLKYYNGTSTQEVDAMLLSDLPDMIDSNFYMRGISYLRARFKYKRDVYTSAPNPSVVIKGKSNIYDPRDNTYKYTNNPALCIADYLMERRGLRVSSSQIDWDSVAAAANACNEIVSRPGGTEARWRCNGIVDTERRPVDVLKEMLSSMAGRAAWRRGKWSLWAGCDNSSPTQSTITADDFVNLEGDDEKERLLVLAQRSRRSSANIARAVYIDEKKFWHATDTPAVKHTERFDAEGELPIDYRHSFTTSRWASQRALHIAMNTLGAKPIPSVTGSLSLHDGLKYAVGDTVTLSLPQYNVTNKTYLVTDWQLDESRTVKVTLQRDGASIYAAPTTLVT